MKQKNSKNHSFPVLKKDYILRQYTFADRHSEAMAIFGLTNGVRIGLNEDGLFMLKKFTGQYSIAEIAWIISQNFGIGLKQANDTVHAVITDLEKKGVVWLDKEKKLSREFPEKITTRGILDTVYIKLSNACNLNCIHCSSDSRYRLENELPEEKFFELVDQIHNLMVPAVVFTGGEPTLARFLPELVHYACNKPLDVTVMTNGYAITESYARRLAKNGLRKVNISIDGAKAKTHDDFRRTAGSFRKTMDAIRIFRDLGIDVETTTVVTKENYLEVDDIVKLKQEFGLTEMKFLPITPRKRGRNCNYKESYSAYVNDTLKKPACLLGSLEWVDKSVNHEWSFEDGIRCSAGTSVLAILSDGNVLSCVNFPSIILGNVKEQSLYDIYNHSPRMADVQETVQIKGSECEGCTLLNYCKGGCVNVSFSHNGKYNGCDIVHKEEVKAMMKREGIELPKQISTCAAAME